MSESKVHSCLFPVAGYGTRFLPITKSIPKEMIPIMSKPLIQFAVEEANEANILEMVMVISSSKEVIKDYFQQNTTIEKSIQGSPKENLLADLNKIIFSSSFSYVYQNQMLGLGHAIAQGKELLGDQSFAVILPDDLCINQSGKSVISQLISLHEQYPECSIIAVEEVQKNEVHNYGIIDGVNLYNNSNVIRVSNMIEKPNIDEAPTNLAIIGRYILTPDIFKILNSTKQDSNGEIQITDALMQMAMDNKMWMHMQHLLNYTGH